MTGHKNNFQDIITWLKALADMKVTNAFCSSGNIRAIIWGLLRIKTLCHGHVFAPSYDLYFQNKFSFWR